MILNEGLNRIRDLIDTDIDVGQLGTGTTLETPTQTGLVSSISDSSGSGSSVSTTKTSRQFVKQYTANSGIGNTNTVTEFAFRRSTSPITDFNRVTFVGVTKNNTIDIRIKTRFFINSLI